jgi:hypothetical protein
VKKGFTGVTVSDRVKNVGAPSNLYENAGECASFHTSNIKKAISSFMETAYHRAGLISTIYTDIGVAVSGNTIVIDLSFDDKQPSLYDGTNVYPYNNMTNVPIGFYGFENPNPITKFKVPRTGSIISYYNFWEPENIKAIITDSKGVQLPFYSENYSGLWFFYPKSELTYGEKYTVSVSFYNEFDVKKETTKWSFTTESKPTTTLGKEESNLEINGRYVSTKLYRFLEDQ